MSMTKNQFDTVVSLDLMPTVFKDAPRPWSVKQTSQLISEAADGHVVYNGDGIRIVDAHGKGIVGFHGQTATNVARAMAIIRAVNAYPQED